MSGFWALNLRRLVARPGRLLLSLSGVAVGSLLMVTTLGLFGSLTGSVDSLAKLAGRADVEVAGSTDAGLDQSIVAAVVATPGVRAAAPVLRSAVTVRGNEALLVGADPATSAQLGVGLDKACTAGIGSPTSLDAVPVVIGGRLAADLHLRRGDAFEVAGAAGPVRARVLGVVSCTQAQQLDRGMFVGTIVSAAQVLAGRPGRVDSVFVEAAPGVAPSLLMSRLATAVGDRGIVSSPKFRVVLAKEALQPVQQGLSMLIGLAFVVAGFLVFNTMSMAALERRRELATLRAIGGRRSTLLVGFLAEASVLGLVGSAVGALAGIGVARASLSRVPTIFNDLLGIQPSFRLPALAVPAGVIVGTLATVAAAYFPARGAVGVAPVEAMRPEGVLEGEPDAGRVRPVIVVVGSILFAGGTVATIVGTSGAVIAGFGALTVGVIVGSYGLTGPLARSVGKVAGAFGSTGRLAAAGIERAPRRLWSTTLAVVVAVGIVISIGGLTANQKLTFANDFASLGTTDLWVQASTPDTVPVRARIPEEWVGRIQAIPGVVGVARDHATYMDLDGDQVIFEGMDSGTNVPFYRVAGAAGRRVLAGEGILVSRGWAARRHLHVGDLITVPTPSGAHRERVAGVVDVPVVVRGQLAIDSERYRQWFSPAALTSIEVKIDPHADRARVRRDVLAVTASSASPVHVYSGAQVLAGANESLRQSLAIFSAMVWVVVGATALAILNTLAISAVERRREIGILRAIGTSRKVIRRMVVTEAASVTTAGVAIGTLLGVVQHRVAVQAIVGLVGFGVQYRFVMAPLVTAVIAAAVMTVAGSVGPAWRASRVEVIEAIGYD